MRTWDVIVVGTGGIGSAALHQLARRGAGVLGIDQFPPGHDRGSSHGETRIIRLAYFEHPAYVPLLRRAYVLWDELEQAAARALFHRCGLIEVGPPDGIVLPGVRRSAREHDLPLEELQPGEFARRFPGFRLPDTCSAVFEPTAGYLRVESCVVTHLEQAVAHGAAWRHSVVRDWSVDRSGKFTIQTDEATETSDRLVICGGAWSRRLLADLGLPLRLLIKHLHWCPAGPMMSAHAGCPTFFYETPAGTFYGFPAIDGGGVKVGEHSGGTPLADPDLLPRAIDPVDQDRVRQFVRTYLPGVTASPEKHATCMYTMTPSEHFLVGRHPTWPTLAFAAGLSGHGFKFAPVLGQALADLALDGQTALPIDFLSPSAHGICDPTCPAPTEE